MRRLGAFVFAALLAAGCSKEKQPEAESRPEMCASVKEAVYRICKLERTEPSDHGAKLLDVTGMSARDFKRELVSFPGETVRVWMPGEKHWLLIGCSRTNTVSLAKVMDEFAADRKCTMSVAEVFASYAGTREDVLPAFGRSLKGEVVPEWFVTKDIPKLDWLDTSGIDGDILSPTLAEIRSMQVVRRLVLEGNMLAAKATDKAGEEKAAEAWARAALRNPNDPMLRERIDRLNRNAKGFLEVGKVLQAMKCYETIVLVTPKDAAAVHNFGMCLKKIGKLDLAEKVLAKAEKLSEELDHQASNAKYQTPKR